MKDFVDYIQSIHPLSKPAIDALLEICVVAPYKKNEIVQDIGQSCKTIFFIRKGALRIFYFKGETDITESMEFENAFVARVESLVTGEPSKKGIQALEESELIAINASKLEQLYDQHLDLERLFKKIFVSAFVGIIHRIESIQFHSAEIRYSNFLKEHPDVLMRVPLKYIASYLGITQVSLSRIRSKH